MTPLRAIEQAFSSALEANNQDIDDLQNLNIELIRRQWFLRADAGKRQLFNLAVQFQQELTVLYHLMGYQLVVDEHFGLVGIMPKRFKARTLPKLTSILALILRQLHHSESLKGCTDAGISEPPPGLVCDTYSQLTKTELPSKREMNDALEQLADIGLIRLSKEVCEQSKMHFISVLPSIEYVIDDAYMLHLAKFAASETHTHDPVEATTVIDSKEAAHD